MSEARAEEIIAKPYKLAVSIVLDTVSIELICGDEYAANVLYDDIIDRLKAGEGLTLKADQGARTPQ